MGFEKKARLGSMKRNSKLRLGSGSTLEARAKKKQARLTSKMEPMQNWVESSGTKRLTKVAKIWKKLVVPCHE